MKEETQSFWLERWQAQEIGFHLDAAHPWLVQFHNKLGLAKGEQILVPLAGKSLDIIFLKECGYRVLAVELSERALEDFIQENNLTVRNQEHWEWGKMVSFDNIDFVVADWFAVPSRIFSDVKAVYDRAALIALEPSDRRRYIQQLKAILPCPLKLLLVTLDYKQEQMSGPPYSVPEQEVLSLYHPFDVRMTVLKRKSIIDEEPRFKAKGVDELYSTIYHLT